MTRVDMFLTEEGQLLELENAGPFPIGTDLHVAGALGAPDADAFLFDTPLLCADITGRLEIGFGCSPVFVSDVPVGSAGNVFFLENNASFPIGVPFCVKGGITGCGGCPVPCLVSNSAGPCR